MSRLDPNPSILTLAAASLSGPEPVHRLIVLIPDVESDYTPAVHRIWELANALESHILFLGLCRDAAEEPRLRRGLVTMSALASNGKVSAEAKVEFGNNWMDIVKANWVGGDSIVCFKGQRAGLLDKPLNNVLKVNLNATVYVLSHPNPKDLPRPSRFPQIVPWSGLLGVIFGFFWLQIKIEQLPKDWAHSALLILSVFIEFWLIWVWNSLFS